MITVSLRNSDAPNIEFDGELAFAGRATGADSKRRIVLAIYEGRTINDDPYVSPAGNCEACGQVGRHRPGCPGAKKKRRRDAEEVVRYAFTITYGSSWEHERTHYLSSLADDLDSLEKQLRAVDPTRWIVGLGHINSPERARRQEELMRDMRERWQGLVATAMQHVR